MRHPATGHIASRLVLSLLCLLGLGSQRLVFSADRVNLDDDPTDARVFQVTSTLAVTGKIYPQPGAESALPLKVDAGFKLLEKRLEGAGRQAQALRSIRYYDQAGASITAGKQVSNADLRDECRLVVAEGTDAGIDVSSPSGPLQVGELELLRTAGDSLAVAGLLPDTAVEPSDTWKPATWVLPVLAGIEAVEKSQLSCRLEKLTDDIATISFQGEIIGAVLGAAAKVHIEGELEYKVSQRHWQKLTLTQTEKRAVGAVSPGLDVEAKITTSRRLAKAAGRLSETDLKGVPLESNDASRLLAFDAPLWNTRVFHSRDWHLLNQNSDSALLRMLEKGELLAQCSIKKLADAEPGKHVPEEIFQKDIQKTLGKNFQKLVQAERLRIREGLYVYRVVAVGTVPIKNEKDEEVLNPMQWNYYLVANTDGRQLALVFSVAPELAAKFKDRDLAIVGGLEFLKAAGPTQARGKKQESR
ncbi:MAG: hypothetical protein NT069_05000 [Planctomycetota bacterium]|nr:hypothetical protein [Planctomycetota bacterium]